QTGTGRAHVLDRIRLSEGGNEESTPGDGHERHRRHRHAPALAAATRQQVLRPDLETATKEGDIQSNQPSRRRLRHARSIAIGPRPIVAGPCYFTYCSGVTTKSSGSFTPVAWFGQ